MTYSQSPPQPTSTPFEVSRTPRSPRRTGRPASGRGGRSPVRPRWAPSADELLSADETRGVRSPGEQARDHPWGHGTFLLEGCNNYYNGFYMSLNNQEYNKKPCYIKVFPSVAVNDNRPCLWSTEQDRWSLSHAGSRDIMAELLNGRWSRSTFLHIALKFVSKKRLCREFLKAEEGNERNALRNTIVSCLGHDMPDGLSWESRHNFYYQVLEVDSTADNAKIKQAFKRLVLKTHPDKLSAKDVD